MINAVHHGIVFNIVDLVERVLCSRSENDILDSRNPTIYCDLVC